MKKLHIFQMLIEVVFEVEKCSFFPAVLLKCEKNSLLLRNFIRMHNLRVLTALHSAVLYECVCVCVWPGIAVLCTAGGRAGSVSGSTTQGG